MIEPPRCPEPSSLSLSRSLNSPLPRVEVEQFKTTCYIPGPLNFSPEPSPCSMLWRIPSSESTYEGKRTPFPLLKDTTNFHKLSSWVPLHLASVRKWRKIFCPQVFYSTVELTTGWLTDLFSIFLGYKAIFYFPDLLALSSLQWAEVKWTTFSYSPQKCLRNNFLYLFPTFKLDINAQEEHRRQQSLQGPGSLTEHIQPTPLSPNSIHITVKSAEINFYSFKMLTFYICLLQ